MEHFLSSSSASIASYLERDSLQNTVWVVPCAAKDLTGNSSRIPAVANVPKMICESFALDRSKCSYHGDYCLSPAVGCICDPKWTGTLVVDIVSNT